MKKLELYCSDANKFANACLRLGINLKTPAVSRNDYTLSYVLRERWRQRLVSCRDHLASRYHPVLYWKAYNCPSCIIIDRGKDKSKLRACLLSWLCPFCYGRRLIELFKVIKRLKFHVAFESGDINLADTDLSTAFHESCNKGRRLKRRYQNIVTWRVPTPTQDGYWLRTLYLWPSESGTSAEVLTQELSAILAYPGELLNSEDDTPFLNMLAFTREHRCFSVCGDSFKEYFSAVRKSAMC